MEAAIETARLWEERTFPPAPCDIPAPGKGQRKFSIPVTPEILADMAVQALLDEVDLTPKPGLVDQRGSGAHTDLTRDLMHRSAVSLWPCFRSMARVARQPPPYAALREELGAIGREGEVSMQGIVPQSDDGCVVAKGTIDGQPAVVIAMRERTSRKRGLADSRPLHNSLAADRCFTSGAARI